MKEAKPYSEERGRGAFAALLRAPEWSLLLAIVTVLAGIYVP